MWCLLEWGRRVSGVLGTRAPGIVWLLAGVGLAILGIGLACQSMTPTPSISSAPGTTPSMVTGVPADAVPVATATPSTASPVTSSYRVVVANVKDSSLSILDAEAQKLLETINLMVAPRDVAVTYDGRYALYTSDEPGSDTVVVFDLLGRQAAGEITVGSEPGSIILDPTGKIAYVANRGSNTLSVVDVDRRREITSIPVGNQPRALVYVMRTGGLVYTADFDDNGVSVVDATTRRVIGKVSVGRSPIALATTPNGQYVYAANAADDSVSVIDVTEQAVTATIPLPGTPTDLAVSPTGQLLYVTVFSDPTEASNDRRTDGGTDRVGGGTGTATSSGYERDGMVVVVDPATNQIVGNIAVAQRPASVVFSGDGTKAFVANASSDSVAVIEVGSRNVIANVDVGDEPVDVTIADGPTLPPSVASQTAGESTATPAASAQSH